MIIKQTSHGQVDLIEIIGRLDMEHANQARTALVDIVDKGAGLLVVDCGDLDFVDSSGLSVLVSALKRVNSKGGKMVISNLTPHLQSLLALTRLHEVLQVFSSTQAAIDYLREQA